MTSTDVDMVKSNYRATLLSASPAVFGTEVNGGQSQRSRLEKVTAQFSQDVGLSVSVADAVLSNLTTATDVAPANLRLSYDNTTNTLTIGLASGVVLPAGNYRLTLLAAGIANDIGQPLGADVVLSFHVLPGDTNGDRIVNDLDLYLVWQNLLRPLAARNLNADVDGDGQVTSADVTAVKSHYLATVPVSASPSLAEANAQRPISLDAAALRNELNLSTTAHAGAPSDSTASLARPYTSLWRTAGDAPWKLRLKHGLSPFSSELPGCLDRFGPHSAARRQLAFGDLDLLSPPPAKASVLVYHHFHAPLCFVNRTRT